MKRHATNRAFGPDVIYTALEQLCPDCGRTLPVYQRDPRRVQGLDEAFWLIRRDKRCRKDCPGPRPIWYAPRDLRVVLPNRIYGLDVTLYVGEHHLRERVALAQTTRTLNERGLPIDQRHTGRVFRDFLALTTLARGDDAELCARLRAQGGMVLMCDGVQFDNRSPVLYLAWDAISGQPLFGERKPFRGADDLVPLLERVRSMDVPVIGVVTDKEKGLVPAVERVFPGVPYQFCHTHFLKNCAKPLEDDLSALGASVRRRAEAVRKVSKELASSAAAQVVASSEGLEQTSASPVLSIPSPPSPEPSVVARCQENGPPLPAPAVAPLTEEELAQEVCELVRVNSRVSGKAPLDPPELKRHDRLEEIRNLVNDARKKKPRGLEKPSTGPGSTS